MQVGEVRKLVAPPYLVKRSGYPPNVSPDSTLVYRNEIGQNRTKIESIGTVGMVRAQFPFLTRLTFPGIQLGRPAVGIYLASFHSNP